MIDPTSLNYQGTRRLWDYPQVDVQNWIVDRPPPAWRLASELNGVKLLGQVREILGDELTAAVVVGRWCGTDASRVLAGVENRRHLEGRLVKTLGIVGMLRRVEQLPTIQAWFAGMNPFLDDQPPALVMASDPEAVVLAARDFVAYG